MESVPGYSAELFRALVALGAVCLLAVVVLKAAARRGLGMGQPGPVRVLQRIPLEHRRTLYLVRVGERGLLIGVGEGGSPALLAELEPEEIGGEMESGRLGEAAPPWLGRWLRAGRGSMNEAPPAGGEGGSRATQREDGRQPVSGDKTAR